MYVMYYNKWVGYGFLTMCAVAVLLLWASHMITYKPITEREKTAKIKTHEANIYELAVDLDSESDIETKRIMILDIISECNEVLETLKMKSNG